MLTYIIYFFALIIFSYVVYLSIKAINTGLKAKKIWTVDTVNTFYDAKNNTINLIPVFGVIVNNKKIINLQ